jgi:hypothetical protein
MALRITFTALNCAVLCATCLLCLILFLHSLIVGWSKEYFIFELAIFAVLLSEMALEVMLVGWRPFVDVRALRRPACPPRPGPALDRATNMLHLAVVVLALANLASYVSGPRADGAPPPASGLVRLVRLALQGALLALLALRCVHRYGLPQACPWPLFWRVRAALPARGRAQHGYAGIGDAALGVGDAAPGVDPTLRSGAAPASLLCQASTGQGEYDRIEGGESGKALGDIESAPGAVDDSLGVDADL